MADDNGNQRKYSDAFKIQMVEECRVLGATVPIVSNRHGVPRSRIYAWRMDKRYQGDAEPPQDTGFVEVAVAGEPATEFTVLPPVRTERIEITLENGRRLLVSDGVDAAFVLVLGLTGPSLHIRTSCGTNVGRSFIRQLQNTNKH